MNLELLETRYNDISYDVRQDIKEIWNLMKDYFLKIEEINDEIDIIHNIKPKLIGKDGSITKLMQKIKDISDQEEKKKYASLINEAKKIAEEKISEQIKKITIEKIKKRLENEKIDETLPTKSENLGSIHQITKVSNEIIFILQKYGFKLYNAPEIDSVDNNFTNLNISENHPARQMMDTFYIENNENYVMRTHTSNTQIHTMKTQKPPIRGISFGKTFRSDSDATHSPMFHQIECFCVDENVNMSNLKWIIHVLLEEFFQSEINVRFRPSFFPFTEPSAEVDISYKKENDRIVITKSDQFLEIGGCGMINENVFINCKIDPEKYQGFAFGFGVDRMAMLKYGSSDIRNFYQPRQEWIHRNSFKFFEL